MAPPDHLNNIERKLIDQLRAGQYSKITGGTKGTANAWAADGTDVTVFGQFPTTDQTKYPAIITEMVANGIETQFMGQKLSFGASATEQIGELYGVGFNIYLIVDRDCSITPTGGSTKYKQRRLINYLMLNSANILMDTDFSTTDTEVDERHFSGFKDIGYDPKLEHWVAVASMVIVFKNTRT